MTREQVQQDITQFLTEFCTQNGATQEFLDKCLIDLDKHLDLVFPKIPMATVLDRRKPRYR